MSETTETPDLRIDEILADFFIKKMKKKEKKNSSKHKHKRKKSKRKHSSSSSSEPDESEHDKKKYSHEKESSNDSERSPLKTWHHSPKKQKSSKRKRRSHSPEHDVTHSHSSKEKQYRSSSSSSLDDDEEEKRKEANKTQKSSKKSDAICDSQKIPEALEQGGSHIKKLPLCESMLEEEDINFNEKKNVLDLSSGVSGMKQSSILSDIDSIAASSSSSKSFSQDGEKNSLFNIDINAVVKKVVSDVINSTGEKVSECAENASSAEKLTADSKKDLIEDPTNSENNDNVKKLINDKKLPINVNTDDAAKMKLDEDDQKEERFSKKKKSKKRSKKDIKIERYRSRSREYEDMDRDYERSWNRSREGRRSRDRSRESRRSRDRSREGRRSQDRSRESRKSRDRSLEYGRYRDRSRGRSRRSRDRSRERRSRDRSQEGRRSRDRSRESRRRLRDTSQESRKPQDKSREDKRSLDRSQENRSSQDGSKENTSLKPLKQSTSGERKDSQKKAEGKEQIDKSKLLEVARKNVLTMIEKGTLPQGIEVISIKKEQLIPVKSGGNSVKELTDFCRTLSEREGKGGDYDSTSKDGSHDESEQPFIHHPFKLKEPSVIKLNIKNATPLPIKTHAEKVTENARVLSAQFPVSSGNQHRQLEWIPVEKKTEPEVIKTTESRLVLSSNVPKQLPQVTPKSSPPPMPAHQPPPPTEAKVPPLPPPPPLALLPLPPPPPSPPPLPPPPPPPLPSLPQPPQSYSFYNSSGQTSFASNSQVAPLSFSTASSSAQMQNPVFSNGSNYVPMPRVPITKPRKPLDLHAIVAKRFKALQILQQTPDDPKAIADIQDAQMQMQAWVESKQVPGQFTGSTNVRLLSVEELSGPRPVWVKKDIFTRAAPVTEGKGMSLLRKMGWNPGEGLGKNKEGSLEPLFLDIKTDKRGLVAEADRKKVVQMIPFASAEGSGKAIPGKHPVSALMEYCSKKKWPPPLYTELIQSGPPHKRQFLFKVQVNNVEYQSAVSRNNKKLAKADAAVICLKCLNVLPNDFSL